MSATGGADPQVLRPASCVLDFLLSLPLWFAFDRDGRRQLFQFAESRSPGSSLGVALRLRRSTASRMLLVLLTHAARCPRLPRLLERHPTSTEQEYYVFLLLLQTACSASSSRSTSSCSTSSGRSCWCRCTSSSASGAARGKLYAAIKFFLYTLVGLGADAARHPGALLLHAGACQGWNGGHPATLRPTVSMHAAHLIPLDTPDLALRSPSSSGLRHQGADVPVPHLAAGRPRRGADRAAR